MGSRILVAVVRMAVLAGYWALPAAEVRVDVAPARIAALAESSERIVVAKVESVVGRDEDGDRRARATVMEVWKGPKLQSVEYSATPERECDIAHAEPGEVVLLFLAKDDDQGWRIAWAGRGRMPLRTINRVQYVTFFMDVIFPEETPLVNAPEPSDPGFGAALEMKTVKKLVSQAVEEQRRLHIWLISIIPVA